MDSATLIGLMAAFCTTVSYYPQLKKCWATGSAGDLSLTMFITLSAGVGLWVVYGFLKSDVVIIIANAVSLALLLGILYLKLRKRPSPGECSGRACGHVGRCEKLTAGDHRDPYLGRDRSCGSGTQ
jgi:MtN3 and saliva related transmembrane protein